MATIGQQLLQPEAGWKRIEDNDQKIIYEGNWTKYTRDSAKSGGTGSYISEDSSLDQIKEAKVKLFFYGNKLRYITEKYIGNSPNTIIEIDGIKYICNGNGSPFIYQMLGCEILNLDGSLHKVLIYSGDSYRISIDAIDINDDGYLLTEEEYLNMLKTYLIHDDNKYKSIRDNNLLEILNYKEEFMKDYSESLCIKDLSTIPDYISHLSDKFNIVKRQVI